VSWIGLGLYEQWGLGLRVIVMSMSLSQQTGEEKKWIEINGLFVSYLRLAVEGRDKVHACLLFRWPQTQAFPSQALSLQRLGPFLRSFSLTQPDSASRNPACPPNGTCHDAAGSGASRRLIWLTW